jgi:hypothetical protein
VHYLPRGAITQRRSALRLNDLALAVMTARTANVMRTALLAAIRAFVVARRTQLVVRTAHIPLRRRRFSFWDRHGGQAPSETGMPNRQNAHALGAPAFLSGAAK